MACADHNPDGAFGPVLATIRQVCHACRLARVECERLAESPCRQRKLLRDGLLTCPRGMFEVNALGVVVTRRADLRNLTNPPAHAAGLTRKDGTNMLTEIESKEAVSMDKIALRAVAIEQPGPNAGHRLTVSVSRYGQLPDGRKVFGSDVRTLRIPDLEKLASDPAEADAAAPILAAAQALADAVVRYASAKGVI